jgi:hypothetical protein
VAFVRVGFNVEGEQQISRAFEATAIEAADLSEPLEEMGDVILGSVREQFGTQGASGLGTQWAPLDPDYAAWKLAHFGPRPILVRQGGMKGAMLNKRTAIKVSPHRLVYQPRNRYAVHHQRGHDTLPQRKMVALTTAQKRAAVDRVFHGWLVRVRAAAKAAGA